MNNEDIHQINARLRRIESRLEAIQNFFGFMEVYGAEGTEFELLKKLSLELSCKPVFEDLRKQMRDGVAR